FAARVFRPHAPANVFVGEQVEVSVQLGVKFLVDLRTPSGAADPRNHGFEACQHEYAPLRPPDPQPRAAAPSTRPTTEEIRCQFAASVSNCFRPDGVME